MQPNDHPPVPKYAAPHLLRLLLPRSRSSRPRLRSRRPPLSRLELRSLRLGSRLRRRLLCLSRSRSRSLSMSLSLLRLRFLSLSLLLLLRRSRSRSLDRLRLRGMALDARRLPLHGAACAMEHSVSWRSPYHRKVV